MLRKRLRDVGEDPDPRFTFANERTFLAWNRTALALVAAGVAASQFLEDDLPGARWVLALPLILLGAGLAAASLARWRASERALRLGEPLPEPVLPVLLAAGVTLVALAAAVLAILDAV